MVTTGTAGALTLNTAAVITGTDDELIRDLADISYTRDEVIKQVNYRFGYDRGVYNKGMENVELEDAREIITRCNKFNDPIADLTSLFTPNDLQFYRADRIQQLYIYDTADVLILSKITLEMMSD